MESNLPILLFLVPSWRPWSRRSWAGSCAMPPAGWPSRRWPARLSLSVQALVRVLTTGTLHTHMGGWPPPIGIEVLLDPLSAFIAATVSVVALMVVTGGIEHSQAELPRRKVVYYPSVLLLMAGLMGITITGDLFNLFVQIEVASLAPTRWWPRAGGARRGRG
jgi:NADH:ubiquinone oxidoreductase subunit 5 (subunit L)/multisubunit Na+/H+ antiporter MnhA subunit